MRDKEKGSRFSASFFLAGTAGFEPASAGVKVPCLTAWRRPNILFYTKIRKALGFAYNSLNGVADGIRTHDLQGHNLAL